MPFRCVFHEDHEPFREAACANLTTDNGMRLFELGVGWKRTSVWYRTRVLSTSYAIA